MDKFNVLEPVRLYTSATASGAKQLLSLSSVKSSKSSASTTLIGRLPRNVHLIILTNLPIPDFPAYARTCRASAELVRDEKVWKQRWQALSVHSIEMLDYLDTKAKADVPPTITVDDEFGDFASFDNLGSPPTHDEMGDFVGAFSTSSGSGLSPTTAMTPNFGIVQQTQQVSTSTFKAKYIRAHGLLKRLTPALLSPSHLVLSELAQRTLTSSSLRQQAQTIQLLLSFLSPFIQPLKAWKSLYAALRAAADRFDATLLAAFYEADGRADEKGMKEAAEASWQVWDHVGDWELSKVWAEKREIFYEQGKWSPLDNITSVGALNFEAMDDFMAHVVGAIIEHGSRAVRVFPPASRVIITFAERLASEVVGEYITSLLTRTRELSNELYLKSVAASFRESQRIVDAILQAAKERKDSDISKTQAEDVIYRMFEINMDEYLDEEVESMKHAFQSICKEWDKKSLANNKANLADSSNPSPNARFVNSSNPALVKRNVLASFTSVLLLPVTIVPRTVGAVGAALTTGGNAAAQGIGMLNPQRWGASGATGATPGGEYSRNFEKGDFLFDEDEEEPFSSPTEFSSIEKSRLSISTVPSSDQTLSTSSSPLPPSSATSQASSISKPSTFDLLLSLDIALELIHASREALKRVETFAGYPGHYGHRVRDTIEEVFILFLQTLGERHVQPGFAMATEKMASYQPQELAGSEGVAPLLQFFELVHMGDTIQSMVQVYFDKELAPHIDKTDFLNTVVREKKRFENALDDSVASGLNAGTEVLMNQVDHIILVQTKPREYYPPEDKPLDLGPTKGCTAAIACLDIHCRLLKGSTSKEVLEVFYQEIGIRLITILQKHIKRQIISLAGGFQVIADLNTYYVFISSLKIPSITSEFSHLKMLGHVFVVEDAKDLAQIVRDVTRYGGAYRPEDIYEFIQRRSDWKKIERTVDKAMYNLSFKEDCVLC